MEPAIVRFRPGLANPDFDSAPSAPSVVELEATTERTECTDRKGPLSGINGRFRAFRALCGQ
jgi:hypothetical protein